MDNMLDTVLKHLEARKGEWELIAREAGVARNTVYRIGNGKTKNPTIQNVEKLYRYFTKEAA